MVISVGKFFPPFQIKMNFGFFTVFWLNFPGHLLTKQALFKGRLLMLRHRLWNYLWLSGSYRQTRGSLHPTGLSYLIGNLKHYF
jgi:hypothetical protein